MKNFMFGILAGLILFVGYNNKSSVANIGLNIIKGTAHAVSKSFTPQITQSQEVAKQQVIERKAISKLTQRVASKVLPQANAAVIPAQPKPPQYIASTNNDYIHKSISPNVSQYKSKRQNSRTKISLISE